MEIGSVELRSPEFLQNKLLSVRPDIVRLDKNAPNPAFGMILGMDTLRNFGVILNFVESTITIDHHEVIMRQLDDFTCIKTRSRICTKKGSTKYPAGYLLPWSTCGSCVRR